MKANELAFEMSFSSSTASSQISVEEYSPVNTLFVISEALLRFIREERCVFIAVLLDPEFKEVVMLIFINKSLNTNAMHISTAVFILKYLFI
jgi:hypothetical protein